MVWRGVEATGVEEVEARNEGGEDRLRGVRGEGMECRRSGMMGRQFVEVERRSLRVVKHDFWTDRIEDANST